LLGARLAEASGCPGDYRVVVNTGVETTTVQAGAIFAALAAHPRPPGAQRWYDRSRVFSQAEFEAELATTAEMKSGLRLHDIVMILCAEEAGGGRCSRVCCLAAIRQAMAAKRAAPEATVTILYRDLYLGGGGDQHAADLQQSQELGVKFLRYPADCPPEIGADAVEVCDTADGRKLRLPFDRVVLAMPQEPPEQAGRLAALLGLPQDGQGFLLEPRPRLRPGDYLESGIYVLDGTHQPADPAEALFQAYAASARAARFLNRSEAVLEGPAAEVDARACTGCGECLPACPRAAISMQPRDGVLSLAAVEPLRCTACGNCVVACPVKAIGLPGWDEAALLAQLSAALAPEPRRPSSNGRANGALRIVVMACEWSAYAAADLAGARFAARCEKRFAYPAEVRILRMPCAARVDPNHLLWAFLNGADGILVGACPPGECHHGLGNLFAKRRVEALQRQMAEHGINPIRLGLAQVPNDDGEAFAQAVRDLVNLVTGGQYAETTGSRSLGVG
jgi:heterodisulfide reductase subunit A